MKSLKNIWFNDEVITATYEEGTDVQRIVDWMLLPHEMKRVEVGDNKFLFKYKGYRFLSCILTSLITQTADVRTERFCKDEGTYCTEHLQAVAHATNLFRVTVHNEHGTIGVDGFGCWQFGKILQIDEIRGGIELSLRNSNLDLFVHKLAFFEENEDKAIEIDFGKFQF